MNDNNDYEQLNNLYSQLNDLKTDLYHLTGKINQVYNDIYNCNNNSVISQVTNHSTQLLNFQECIREINNSITTLLNNQAELKEIFAPEISEKINGTEYGNIIKTLKKQKKTITDLNNDYKRSKQYLDVIDDNLDQFEDALMSLTQENEIILTGLLKLKTGIDDHIISANKDNIVLTGSILVMLHDLILKGIIDGETYINNFTKVLSDISDIYAQNGVNLDFSEDINIINGNFQPNNISIKLPNIAHNPNFSAVNMPVDKDKKVITITEAKKMAADRKKMVIKNNKTKKSEQLRNSLDADENDENDDKLPDNVIDNIFEKIKQIKERKNGKDKEE